VAIARDDPHMDGTSHVSIFEKVHRVTIQSF
jgi:hypothetical protein